MFTWPPEVFFEALYSVWEMASAAPGMLCIRGDLEVRSSLQDSGKGLTCGEDGVNVSGKDYLLKCLGYVG